MRSTTPRSARERGATRCRGTRAPRAPGRRTLDDRHLTRGVRRPGRASRPRAKRRDHGRDRVLRQRARLRHAGRPRGQPRQSRPVLLLQERARDHAERFGLMPRTSSGSAAEHVAERYWTGRWEEAMALADEFLADTEASDTSWSRTATRRADGSRRTRRRRGCARRHGEGAREGAPSERAADAVSRAGRPCQGSDRGRRARRGGSVVDELLALWSDKLNLVPGLGVGRRSRLGARRPRSRGRASRRRGRACAPNGVARSRGRVRRRTSSKWQRTSCPRSGRLPTRRWHVCGRLRARSDAGNHCRGCAGDLERRALVLP